MMGGGMGNSCGNMNDQGAVGAKRMRPDGGDEDGSGASGVSQPGAGSSEFGGDGMGKMGGNMSSGVGGGASMGGPGGMGGGMGGQMGGSDQAP